MGTMRTVAYRSPAAVNAQTSSLRPSLLGPKCGWHGDSRSLTGKYSQAPSIVQDVLSTTGEPLDQGMRAFFEPRFGHDFGQVRVHRDSKAAESARAIQASAYTVGHDIVIGDMASPDDSATSTRLLAHELAHVVQQSDMAASGADGYVQRAGFGEVRTTEGGVSSESMKSPLAAGFGLAQPDCSIHVFDVFKVGPVSCGPRPECCLALIYELETNGYEIYRADYPLEGKPPCEYGDQKKHDFWLDNQWRIVDINTDRVTVVNLCGDQETLEVQGFGKILWAQEEAAPKPSKPTPESAVENPPGRLGRGKVAYDPGCSMITFTPEDPSKPSRVFTWDATTDEYVDAADKTRTYTPGQLERLVGITLKEYEDHQWQGKHCGEQPAWVP